MHFFFLQRLILLPNPQQHFGYLTVENRQLSLLQFVQIQAVRMMQHEINLTGKARNTPVSGSGKQQKRRAKGGCRKDRKNSGRPVNDKSKYDRDSCCEGVYHSKLPKFPIPKHSRLPVDIRSRGPSE